MKKSRILVLFLALAAAGGAFMMAGGPSAPPPPPVAALPPPPPPAPTTEDVLSAAKDLPAGTRIGDGDIQWKSWPKDLIQPGMVLRSQDAKALDEYKGSTMRSDIFANDPLRVEKIVKGDGGLMAIKLPSGQRAVAINIDSQGATSAGGFVLPGDRVDVVRTFHQDPKPGAPPAGDSFATETILTDVKVLAIGQNPQEKNGQPVAVGSNATLELSPEQAETVINAQRTGQLSLVLRSVLDARRGGGAPVHEAAHGLSVVRYGTISQDIGR